MLKNLRAYFFPLRLLIFWLLFFLIFRLWFLLWFHQEWSAESPASAWAALWYALPLDFSFAAYLLLLPVLLWMTAIAAGQKGYPAFEKLIFGWSLVLFGILIFIFGANLFIYEEWKTPLNNRAVQYFKTPFALLDSMSFLFKLVCAGLYAFGVWVILKLYRLVVGRKALDQPLSRWYLLSLPLWLGLLVLAIRGGTGVMPINESAVYYSPHLFYNHAATNPGWSLGHSLVETRSTLNRFEFMPDSTADRRVADLLKTSGTAITPGIVSAPTGSTPYNLVFLMLESHSAQVIEELQGEKGVCPNLSKLIREGILFENVYGSGYRTDQGIVSILAGYPAQPDQSIILLEDKASKLPSIPKSLHQKGYSTAFFYGGELTFANLGLWLTNQQFDRILSERDFSGKELTQRWGADDQVVLTRVLSELNSMRQPFFAATMTLSLHPPYDVPYESSWKGTADREKYLNSAAFVDHALGNFFSAAASQPWFDNTIFVLVADHGASQPGGVGMDQPVSRHIPLIIYSKKLNESWKGKHLSMYGNHHDIPALIPSLLGPEVIASEPFVWSRNLFGAPENNSGGFAYYTNENGLGWSTPRGKGFYEFGRKDWRIFEGALDPTDRNNAQAYLQRLYGDFLAK